MSSGTIKMPSIKSQTLTGYTYISGWYLQKIGNVVFLQIYNFSSLPSGAFATDFVLPLEFRPPSQVDFTIVRRSASPVSIAIIVEANGTVRFYNYGSASTSTAPCNQMVSWFTLN